MLADLDYLESRTTEKNTNSMQSFENPYEACKEAHAIATCEWDEFVQYDWHAYMILCKSLLFFDGRNILNGRLWKNRICVSKYRFLGSQPSLQREKAKKVLSIISENYGLHNYNKRYTVDDGD
jgi:hypothetical protein